MKKFRIFAFVSTVASYVLIFTGGLVRVSGAGLGCPDWPKCYGHWIPPISASQLPADIDPNNFNFALAWIEYLNRLCGMVLGILVVITAILALRHFLKVKRILFPTLGAAILVAIAGWQGGQVVTSGLEPLFVSVHLLIALGVVALLTYVTQQTYYMQQGLAPRVGDDKTHKWIGWLGVATLVQILLGTQVRESLEKMIAKFPLANDLEIMAKASHLKYVHMLVGIVVAILAFQVMHLILRIGGKKVPNVRYSVWWMMLLMLVQILIGTGLLTIGIPPVMQVFHLWIAALFLGTIIYLYSAVRYELRES